jgi:hypothetical protein
MDFIGRAIFEKYERKYRDNHDIVRLIERLIEIQPGEFDEEGGLDPFLNKIRIRGHVYHNDIDVINAGLPGGQCHMYAIESHRIKPTMRIVTGYGYYTGKWYRHTWLLDSKTDRMVDIDTRAEIYFGFELSNYESRVFRDYFYREGAFKGVP